MSQKHHEIGMELAPLITLFNDLSDDKMELYCKNLEDFDITVIRQAVKAVQKKWDRVSFPPPGFIVQACEDIVKEPVGARAGSWPWEERNKIISDMMMEYFFTYTKNSTIYAQARAEKWDYSLDRYLRAVAHVQAQLINPNPAGNLIVNWHEIEPQSTSMAEAEKWRHEFLENQKREVAICGQIDVAIPTNKIQEWKTRVHLEEIKYAS